MLCLGGVAIALPIAAVRGGMENGVALSGSVVSALGSATWAALWALEQQPSSSPLKNKKNDPPQTKLPPPGRRVVGLNLPIQNKKKLPLPVSLGDNVLLSKEELNSRMRHFDSACLAVSLRGKELCKENLVLIEELVGEGIPALRLEISALDDINKFIEILKCLAEGYGKIKSLDLSIKSHPW